MGTLGVAKKSVTPERVIEHQILALLRSKGIYCWKQPSSGYFDTKINRFRKQASPYAINGVSDILGILKDGRFLAIECKSAKGKASLHQKAFIDSINNNKGLAFIATSWQQVQELLKDL